MRLLRWFLLVGTLVAGALAAGWWVLPWLQTTQVLRPIDTHTALILRGRGTEAVLAKVDARGRRLWRSRTVGFADPDAAFGGILLTDRLAAFAIQDDHDTQVRAVGLDDGEVRWESVSRWLDDGEPAVEPSLFAAIAGSNLVFFGGGARVRLTALDAASGETRWRRDVFGSPDRMWARGPHLVLAGRMSGEWYRVDAREGRIRSSRAARPCVLDEHVLYQTDDRLALDRLGERSTRGKHVADDLTRLAGPCGRRGDDIVTLVSGINRAAIVGWGDDLTRRWEVEARGFRPLDDGGGAFADLHPLAGSPPRYVPLILAERGSDDLALFLFDLDERREVWRSPPDAAFARFSLWRHENVSYLMDDARLVAFDGQTGEAVGAVQITGALPLRPWHIAGGRVWYATAGGAVSTLDGRTLIPDAHLPGVRVDDARLDLGRLIGQSLGDEETP